MKINKNIIKDNKRACTARINSEDIYTEIRTIKPDQEKNMIIIFDNKKVFLKISCIAKRTGS